MNPDDINSFDDFLEKLRENNMITDDLYEAVTNSKDDSENSDEEIIYELNQEERDALVKKIDAAFEATFLKPREERIVEFLKKVQNFEIDFGSGTRINNEQIKVITLYYYANCRLGFLFVEPSHAVYPELMTADRPELRLEDYDQYDIREMGKKVVEENHSDYYHQMDEEDFDLDEFWENRGQLENKFLIDCWKKAKEETNTKLIGYLMASDASGGPYFLDDAYHPWKTEAVDIKEHFKKLGIEVSGKLE